MCGIGKHEARQNGTWSDPLEPSYLPMVDEHNTALSTEDSIDFYDCAPTTNESGNEVIYRFTVTNPGRFRAKLSDPSGVDIDLHLLQNPQVNNGVASGCIDRAHEELDVPNLPAGTYYLIADSWNGLVGDYRLAFEWDSDGTWNTVPVTDGITWERLTTSSMYGGQQTINVLRVNPSLDVLECVHILASNGQYRKKWSKCSSGINGTFFRQLHITGSCSISEYDLPQYHAQLQQWDKLSTTNHRLEYLWYPNLCVTGSYQGGRLQNMPLVAIITGKMEPSPMRFIRTNGVEQHRLVQQPRTAIGSTANGNFCGSG